MENLLVSADQTASDFCLEAVATFLSVCMHGRTRNGSPRTCQRRLMAYGDAFIGGGGGGGPYW
jgi:hypothetical protein